MKRQFLFTMLAAVTLVAPSLVGCTDEDECPDKKGDASVKVSLEMPAASADKTYALTGTDENSLESIHVLAFTKDDTKASKWAFAYSAEGTSITDLSGEDGSKKEFTVELVKDSQEQTFVFLGNVKKQLEALGKIDAGTDKDELLKRLVVENAGSWNAKLDGKNTFIAFPFWGQLSATVSNATTQLEGLKMLRGIARVDVVLADNVSNFKLNEVYIFNSKTKGQVVPATENLDGVEKVKGATLPTGDINNASPLAYTVPVAMEKAFRSSIYLFEAKAAASGKASEATCVIVGGTYGSDAKPTYYRLDFFKKDGAGKDTNDYRDILRNHRYQVNINSVSGSGYDTPKAAFEAKASNMDCEIVDWNESTTDTDFNGQYYLTVDKNPVELFGDASENNKLVVKTDYPGGWKASIPNETDNWITIESESKTELKFKVASNIGASSERRGFIRIKAGNLSKEITVLQSNSREVSLQITQDGNPVSKILFKSQNPEAKTYQVNWKPAEARCVISVSNSKGNGLSMATLDAPSLSGETQTVLPRSISNEEIAADPFIEKETVITYTLVDDVTGKSVSQSVVLSQINYALVATENTEPYFINGGEKSFKIKSNLPWKVEEISETKIIKSFTRKTGEANMTEHDFSFTVVDKLEDQSVENVLSQLRFTSGSEDPNEQFYSDIVVDINAISGLPFAYDGKTFITAYADVYVNGAYIMTQKTANRECENMGSGWRLPTENELLYGKGATLNALDGKYWSGSKTSLGFYRFVYMPKRGAESGMLTDWHRARCVNGPVK